MSASSGITASQELLDQYALAMEPSANIRFMKIGISEEQLVPLGSWPVMANDLASDFQIFTEIVEENVPAYILAKLDGTAGWLFISYVPDTAKVRDKMLYASSRSAVTKALGGQAFADTMFTTAKSDLTPTAYASHLRHIAAPPPMSAREQELYNIKAAEKEMGEAYEGSRARKNHVGTTVGVKWSPEVEEAVTAVVSGQGKENFAVIALDPSTETLILTEKKIADVDAIASSLPTSEPSFAFYRWQEGKIVFIYACPSSSKVKSRMMYSSSAAGVVTTAQNLLDFKVFKRLETSDPSDLDTSSMKESSNAPSLGQNTGPPSFARPRGPPRKR
ncbi:Twinfilin-1 [Tulasnella sp. JGI-2019a]|nr:Twinfilin-1 [Tulasnella sp. JGI-2019a]